MAATLALTASCGGDEAPEQPEVAAAPTTSSAAPVEPTVTGTESTAEALTDDLPLEATGYDREAVDLSAQVPDNALAYFEFESLDALEELSLRIATLSNARPGSALRVSLATLPLAGIGVEPERIDGSARLALAYVPVPGDLFPVPVIIVPAVDEGPIVSSVSALANRGLSVRRIESGYAVIEPVSLNESTPRGQSSLASGLPETAIRGRFETETFLTLLNPALQPFSKALAKSYRESRPRNWSGPEHDFSPADLTARLRGSKQVGFGFGLEGDRATVQLRLVEVNETEYGNGQAAVDLNATLDELSHHLDTEAPISFVTAFDPETAVKTLRGLWENRDDGNLVGGLDLFALPGDLEEDARNQRAELSKSALDSMERAMVRMLRSFKPGAAVAVQMEPSMGHLAIYMASRHPDRAREAISLLLSKCDLETWGFEMALPIRSMMDGTLVEDYNVRFDTRRLDFDRRAAMRSGFKKYLGDSSLHLKVASVGQHVLVVLGGDTSAVDARIRAFSNRGLAEVEYIRAAGLVASGDAATIGHVDVVEVFGQISGLGAVSRGLSAAETHRELKRETEDSSASFVVWKSQEGRDSIYGSSFDMFSLKSAFEAFENSGL